MCLCKIKQTMRETKKKKKKGGEVLLNYIRTRSGQVGLDALYDLETEMTLRYP